MNTTSVLASPPYSLILILDPAKGLIPLTMNGALIAATNSCVAVGCRAEDDGVTKIILGPADLVDPGFSPIFSGTIETPSQLVEIQTVIGKTLLSTPVSNVITHVSIWTDDEQEPEQITVGISRETI